jgi:hypothetical protein
MEKLTPSLGLPEDTLLAGFRAALAAQGLLPNVRMSSEVLQTVHPGATTPVAEEMQTIVLMHIDPSPPFDGGAMTSATEGGSSVPREQRVILPFFRLEPARLYEEPREARRHRLCCPPMVPRRCMSIPEATVRIDCAEHTTAIAQFSSLTLGQLGLLPGSMVLNPHVVPICPDSVPLQSIEEDLKKLKQFDEEVRKAIEDLSKEKDPAKVDEKRKAIAAKLGEMLKLANDTIQDKVGPALDKATKDKDAKMQDQLIRHLNDLIEFQDRVKLRLTGAAAQGRFEIIKERHSIGAQGFNLTVETAKLEGVPYYTPNVLKPSEPIRFGSAPDPENPERRIGEFGFWGQAIVITIDPNEALVKGCSLELIQLAKISTFAEVEGEKDELEFQSTDFSHDWRLDFEQVRKAGLEPRVTLIIFDPVQCKIYYVNADTPGVTDKAFKYLFSDAERHTSSKQIKGKVRSVRWNHQFNKVLVCLKNGSSIVWGYIKWGYDLRIRRKEEDEFDAAVTLTRPEWKWANKDVQAMDI